MANRKLVIKVPEELLEYFANHNCMNEDGWFSHSSTLLDAFRNGTLLPEGHGDLIDRSKIYKAIPAEEDNCTGMGMTFEEMDAYNEGINAMYALVNRAKPIIKADKTESEDK